MSRYQRVSPRFYDSVHFVFDGMANAVVELPELESQVVV